MTGITRPGARRPRADRPWEPSGAAWEAKRAAILARATRCYHCNCPDAPPDQVEHLISPQKLWDQGRAYLINADENLRPTHSRCPRCGCCCNTIAAGNAAPRDAQGRSLPWDETFKRRKMTEAAAKAARPARSRRELPPSRRERSEAAPRTAAADVGRPW